jgi:hypothetical protein
MSSQKAKPLGFRQWIICEDHKNQVFESAGDGEFPTKIIAYLSAVFDIPEEKLEAKDWVECLKLFEEALTRSPKIDVPIIKNAPREGKDVDWQYAGRNLYYYSHLLASSYGWSLEYVADLGVEEALSLIQEILTEEYLDREFTYSLSEVAYPYNSSTKKSVYKPMPKPYWMKPLVPTMPKRVRMRRDLLPQGLIMDVSGLPDEFKIEGLETVKENPDKK